jgi:hypothetical protein
VSAKRYCNLWISHRTKPATKVIATLAAVNFEAELSCVLGLMDCGPLVGEVALGDAPGGF